MYFRESRLGISASSKPDINLQVLLFLKNFLATSTPSEALQFLLKQDLSIDITTKQSQFMMAVKATLIDFCFMYAKQPAQPYPHNHERTFWVEHVVPIFKYFASLTSLVSFKW